MRLFPAQSFMQTIEILATFFRHDDHVLDPDPSEGLAVKAWLDRDNISNNKLRTADGQ